VDKDVFSPLGGLNEAVTPGPREVPADPFVDRTGGGTHGTVNTELGSKVTGVGVRVNYQWESNEERPQD
jgi:hypothetical protein